MFVLNVVDRLVQTDCFGSIIKQTDLMAPMYQAAETDAYQPEKHPSVIKFVE